MAIPTTPLMRPPAPTSTALLTDHYELTMLRSALHSGVAERRVVFEVFTRALPAGRRYGVLAGTGRLLEGIEAFRFDPDTIDYLQGTGLVDDVTARYLAGYRFGGNIDGFAEGEPFMPHTPVLVLEGTFAECILLETLVLSVLNHDSAVAAAGARMVAAAGGRPCVDMGSRRTHEQAATAAARAAYLVGFASTSNLAAGRQWGIPTAGTAGHAFTLIHPSERAAFTTQVAVLGVDTTLLVDTYDVTSGIATAIEVAGPRLGAVRIDSGDPAMVARAARAQLDSLGASDTRIIATGDVDEYVIERLAKAPVDGYGIGTKLVTGSGAPTAGFVYKLVEVDGMAVAKTSVGKSTKGGRKRVTRCHGAGQIAVADVITIQADDTGTHRVGEGPPAGDGPAAAGTCHSDGDRADRPLLVPLVRGGMVLAASRTAGGEGLCAARAHHASALAALPVDARRVSYGAPCLPVITSGGRPPPTPTPARVRQ